MNIKEQIKEILHEHTRLIFKEGIGNPVRRIGIKESTAHQILDLVLNSLTIEKKVENNYDVKEHFIAPGWNQCVDAYEELKNKLRK